MYTQLMAFMCAMLMYCGNANAWEEYTLDVQDPHSITREGKARAELMEGMYCQSYIDAQTLQRYFRGMRVAHDTLIRAKKHCHPDARYVAGIFLNQDEAYPVIFVRSLSRVVRTYYLIPISLAVAHDTRTGK